MPIYDYSDDPNNEQDTLFKDQLLADIYDGNNLARPIKRNRDIQKNLFLKRSMLDSVSEISLLMQEFELKTATLCDRVLGGRSLTNHIVKVYNKPALQWALANNPHLANHYFDGEQHPLLKAAELNSKEMVDILLEAGANPNLLAYKKSPTDTLAVLREAQYRNVLHETVATAIQSDPKIDSDIKEKIKKKLQKMRVKEKNEQYNATTVMFSEHDDSSHTHEKTAFNKKDNKGKK